MALTKAREEHYRRRLAEENAKQREIGHLGYWGPVMVCLGAQIESWLNEQNFHFNSRRIARKGETCTPDASCPPSAEDTPSGT